MSINYDSFYLDSDTARRLYTEIARDMPIIDYHCHLSPKEIYEDKQFDNIGKIWLADDHYKWRLMRIYGIDEEYITGNASWFDKFKKYAEVISVTIGNPIYYWTYMELNKYFGITEMLNPENAGDIWERANAEIADKKLSPRKLMKASKVEYVGTTDDPCDSLIYHEKIRADKTIDCVVTPSFRADNLLLVRRRDFPEYARKLSGLTGFEINSIEDYEHAISARVSHFHSLGCRFADVGIEYFPREIGTKDRANSVLLKALARESVTDAEYHAFLGYMYCFLASEYKERGIVSQMHISVKRNPNTKLFAQKGPDMGADCIGEQIEYWDIIRLLDTMDKRDILPKTIIYNLNPAMTCAMATIAGAFRGVICGAAWWFCDHKRGIIEHMNTLAETGLLSGFLGMLTDSRSFLSYARHDYFRRILCSFIGSRIEGGEVPDEKYALKLLKDITYGNIKKLVD
ncbi:MAG: glucuronate isomerase [Clostridiales bacterium]|nr:glucuronate isomerase [Clostridiales bacterium]